MVAFFEILMILHSRHVVTALLTSWRPTSRVEIEICGTMHLSYGNTRWMSVRAGRKHPFGGLLMLARMA
jgi:hypothetical protein